MAETRVTYCRICPAQCGLEVEVRDGVVTRAVGYRAQPLTDAIELRSAHGAVTAVVEADDTLLPGVVTMTHGFGGEQGVEDDPLRHGANTTRLFSIREDLQPISLMPLMSAVPVSVTAT